MKKEKIIIPMLIAFLLVGCSSKGMGNSSSAASDMVEPRDYAESKTEIAYDGGAPMEGNAKEESVDIANISDKKIIDRGNLTIETVEFDKSVDTIEKTLDQYKGYMEASNINQPGVGSNNYKGYRNADYVVRVPKENFENFLKAAESFGVITNENTSNEDISKQYYDTETRLKVYEAQEARYLELLKEAKTMEDILTIEGRLTEVRYNIEYLVGYKNQMKDLVDYGTVNISLYEVEEPTKVLDNPKNFGEKIVNVFITSLRSLKTVAANFVLIIVSIIPYGIILGAIGGAGLYIYRKIKKVKK